MRSLSFWLGGALLLVGGCKEEAKETAVVQPRPVRYQKVVSTGGSRTRTFSGKTQAKIESALSFRVSGRLKSIGISLGDDVDKGQVIAELDPTDYELQVQQSEAGNAQARAQLRNAEATYTRVRALYENGNASKSDLDSARAASEGARAQVRANRKRLQLAQNQLDYTKLKAPGPGAIAAVLSEPGENVQAGQPIAQMAGAGKLEVEFAVPEVLITRVSKGSKAEVRLHAMPSKVFAGTVRQVGVASTFGATTYPVTLGLDEAAPALRPGMAAEVAIVVDQSDQASMVIVPPFAVQEDREGRYVYVAKTTGGSEATTERRKVTVGALRTEGLEVKAGLNEGELLITAGVTQIVAGQAVRILPEHEVEASR